MHNNYDRMAGIYDRGAKAVFGDTLIEAQVYLLSFIPENSSVLIAGGGTGWILAELARIHPSGLSVTYVEISANMLAKAQKQDCKANQVTFIHQAIEDFQAVDDYDVVITPFLFDNFSQNRIASVFNHLSYMLKPGGLWLFADFHYDKGKRRYWQRILLHTMLLFFRLMCRIEARGLNDMSGYFSKNGFITMDQQVFFHRFIRSVVYKKVSHTSI